MKTCSTFLRTACFISVLVTVIHAWVSPCQQGKPCRHVIRPMGNDLPHTPESGVYCACLEGECPKYFAVSDKALSWFIDVGEGRSLVVETSFCTPIIPRPFCRRGQVAVQTEGLSPFELNVSKVNCRCRRRRVPMRQKSMAQNLQTGELYYNFMCSVPFCKGNPEEQLCSKVYYNHESLRLRTISVCRCPRDFECPRDMRLPDTTSQKDERGVQFAPVNCAKIYKDTST